jgi:hypothetical protein
MSTVCRISENLVAKNMHVMLKEEKVISDQEGFNQQLCNRYGKHIGRKSGGWKDREGSRRISKTKLVNMLQSRRMSKETQREQGRNESCKMISNTCLGRRGAYDQ